MLKLSICCTGVVIVAVLVGAVKIYVAAMEALRRKERQGETQFPTKIDGFLSFTTPLDANVFFESHLVYDQTQGSRFWCCVEEYSDSMDLSPFTPHIYFKILP
jgi:hypothetical protein